MSLKIAALTVGDELLDGGRSDTNTAAIARLLEARGYRLRESLTVTDDEQDIEAALQRLVREREIVIVTGGLGPTCDDRTAQAAARAFGRRLRPDPQALEEIRAHFRRRALPMDPGNDKQALLPEGSVVLPNRSGTAPGFLLHSDGCDLFFLPGVPAEMAAMLGDEVLPRLVRRQPGEAPRRQRLFKIFGLPESRIGTLLETAGLPPRVAVAFTIEFPEVHLRLHAAGEGAEDLLDSAGQAVRQHLGDAVVARDEETLAGNVAHRLAASGRTLALAESCTGGMIAALLTDVPGASAFLERAAVTYANRAKADWLGVEEAVLAGSGAVSEECARAMARGVRRAAGVDLGLAVTGIAGPAGGTSDKPVGTVYLALSAGDAEWVQRYRFAGDRRQVRLLSAFTALAWLQRYPAAPAP